MLSTQETLRENVRRKSVTTKKPERCLNSRIQRYDPALLRFHHNVGKTEFSKLIWIDFLPPGDLLEEVSG